MRLLVLALLFVSAGCDRFLRVQTISDTGGTPVAGVRVTDNGSWSTTDERGEALLPAPAEAFALQVHQTSTWTATGSAYRYDDVFVLQSPEGEPTVLVNAIALPRSRVRVQGTVSGGSGGPVRVSASGDPFASMPSASVSSGSFTLDVGWEHPGPLDTVLRAVERDSASPPGWVSYGEAPVTLTDPGGGGTLSGAAVTLSAVNQGTVTGTFVTPPLGAGGLIVDTLLRFEGGGRLRLGASRPGASLSVPLPQVAGADAWVIVSTEGTGWYSWHHRKVSVPSSGVAFDLPEAPQLLEPANGATIGAGTVFRWTGGPAGGRTALGMICDWLEPSGTTRRVSFRTLESTGTETTLPELQDLTIAPGAGCFWHVSWTPAGQHLGNTQAESSLDERRGSISAEWGGTFQ